MSNVKDLEQLQTIFKSRLSNSKDPTTFILREIKYIENALDINAPRMPFAYGDLFAVRKAYEQHIVSGLGFMPRHAPAKEGDEIALWSTGPSKPTEDPYEFDFSKARKFKLLPPLEHEVDALNLASTLFEYLKWLRTLDQPDTTEHKLISSPDGQSVDLNAVFSEHLERLRTLNQPATTELIVRRGCIELIWHKYKGYFKGETLDSWSHRFSKNDISVAPIEVEAAAREGTSRLVLIGILASIQDATGNAFDFGGYVRKHFGIKGFEDAKNQHKDKETYIVTKRYCDGVLNK